MNAIPWYKSNTLRGLLVAALAFVIQKLGLAEQFPDSAMYVDYALTGIEGLALAYAAYARARQPSPPVTLAGVTVTKPSDPSAPKASVLASLLSLLLAILLLASALSSAGCSAFATQRAETLEQRAGALLGDFTLYQAASLKVGSDETVPADVRKKVLDAAIAAKPAADDLDTALMQYRDIRRQLAEGGTTDDKLAIAAANLSDWVERVRPLVKSLRNAVEGATP